MTPRIVLSDWVSNGINYYCDEYNFNTRLYGTVDHSSLDDGQPRDVHSWEIDHNGTSQIQCKIDNVIINYNISVYASVINRIVIDSITANGITIVERMEFNSLGEKSTVRYEIELVEGKLITSNCKTNQWDWDKGYGEETCDKEEIYIK